MAGREFATEKTWEELRDVEQHYVRQWTHPTDVARLNAIVRAEWERYLLPTFRDQAIQSKSSDIQYAAALSAVWPLATGLFDALHLNAHAANKGEEPRYFWRHQEFDIFRTHDATRGFAIRKEDLVSCAATYLSQPNIRTSRFDWVFLDAIILAELEAYSHHTFNSRGLDRDELGRDLLEPEPGPVLRAEHPLLDPRRAVHHCCADMVRVLPCQ